MKKLSVFPVLACLILALSTQDEVDEYITFFNEQRPAYSLNYLTPMQYRESYSANFAV